MASVAGILRALKTDSEWTVGLLYHDKHGVVNTWMCPDAKKMKKPKRKLQGGRVRSRSLWTVIGKHISGTYWCASSSELGQPAVKTFRYPFQAKRYAKEMAKLCGTIHVVVPVRVTWRI